MATTYNVMLRNKNHSHPDFPDGLTSGTLVVDDNGLVFHPNNRSLSVLPIHWDNLTSTYPDVQLYPAIWIFILWIFMAYPFVVSMITLGHVNPYVGVLSVKFKDVTFDKICVIDFCSLNFVSFLGRMWAVELETTIWKLKSNHRTDRQQN